MARPVLFTVPMRPALLLLAFAACQGVAAPKFGGGGGGGGGYGSGSGSNPGASIGEPCGSNADCALAATTCCECPSFAVNVDDPSYAGCKDVTCSPAPSCPFSANAEAQCKGNFCVLVCLPMGCPTSCPAGFAIDPATGCLSCMCTDSISPANCNVDSDCVRTRADCCGCVHGGSDTAVRASQQAAFDASLDCPPDPTCPSVNSCNSDLLARCIDGACELAPAAPAGACGSAGLPACSGSASCTINVDPDASAQGLGVCM
jgi:hypothetical protein